MGYDVWMGNSRGNFYSTAHQSLNVSVRTFIGFVLAGEVIWQPLSRPHLRRAMLASELAGLDYSVAACRVHASLLW